MSDEPLGGVALRNCGDLLGHLVVERKFGGRIETRFIFVGAASVDLVDHPSNSSAIWSHRSSSRSRISSILSDSFP